MFAKSFARPGRESLLQLIPGDSLAHRAICGSRALRTAAAQPHGNIANDKHFGEGGEKKKSKLFKLQV